MRSWGKKRTDGFRSAYEATVAAGLTAAGVPFSYEAEKFSLVRKVVGVRCGACGAKEVLKNGTYTPDFTVPLVGTKYRCIVETKGRMTAKDRKTILAFSNIALALNCLYFVLLQKNNRLAPGSPTLYGDWLAKNGITYAIGTVVPPEWYKEAP